MIIPLGPTPEKLKKGSATLEYNKAGCLCDKDFVRGNQRES